jgi:hypothetical protein
MMNSHDNCAVNKLITVGNRARPGFHSGPIRKELGLKTGQPLVWKKISDRECLVKVPRKKKRVRAMASLDLRRDSGAKRGAALLV